MSDQLTFEKDSISKAAQIKKYVWEFSKEYMVLFAIAILVIVTVIVEPKFLTIPNFTNIMRQFGPLIMVSLGMTFVIIGGFIDLSVSGTIPLVVVITHSLIPPLGMVPALIIGLAVGALCGLLNSIIILVSGAITQAEALFITYGTMVVFNGLALLYTGGVTHYLTYMKADYSLFTVIGSGTVGMFSVSFLIFLVILALLWVFQSKTYLGRTINLIGGNKTAARLSGISIKKGIISMFTINGFMAGLSGIILFSRVTQASPTLGRFYETLAIMAVVVGGTSLLGGKGSVIRTVIGTLLVILLGNCMNLLGVDVYMQYIMRGAILVIAIWLDTKRQH
jgi:ribose transport system permease protein